MKLFIFFIIIMLTNIIQGITGFAGTILAMPPSIILVGYEVAKPVLNVLGFLAGVWIFLGKRKHVSWREVIKIIIFMACGMFIAILIRPLFIGREKILYIILGLFVIYLGAKGTIQILMKDREVKTGNKNIAFLDYIVLAIAGIAHGLFVSGGPLLIGYLSRKIDDKVSFRATISTVWVVLNFLILLDDINQGLWSMELIKIQAISIPFFIGGMYIGGKLYSRMSQRLFMGLTYVLLIISGISLLVK